MSAEVRNIWLELLRSEVYTNLLMRYPINFSIYICWSDNFSEKIRAAEQLPLEGQNLEWFRGHCSIEDCLLSCKDL
jgi:hypothetical protein